LKIQTLRAKEYSQKLKADELLKEGEASFENLLEMITDAEQTISKDSFDAISENKKKVGQ
jgi:hypothetical protein